MSTEKNFLYDLGRELVLFAKRIESEHRSREDQFQRGRRFALYEVLSLMKQQAETFGLAATQIGLEEFDIEKLLK
jgi:hypothetical protein